MLNNKQPAVELPQLPESYWRDSTKIPAYPKLAEDTAADVVIVGGGIVGITTAYRLAEAGRKVVLLEADTVMGGTTGHTTAKLTAQHDLIYAQLIKDLGEDNARLYYEANRDALEFVNRTITSLGIDCGYSGQDAYLYAQTVDTLTKLQDEAEAYAKLGIPGGFVEKIPLDVPIHGAVVMHHQAQFHPLQYLSGLLPRITEAGGSIYEHTTAVDVEEGEQPVVITKDGHRVQGDHVVVCSHYPFIDRHGFYFARLHAQRSYVLGVKIAEGEHFPEGMYLSADDPKRSVRTAATLNGEKLVLVGGENHKTGQGLCTIQYYEALRDYAVRHFNVDSIPYRWSAQDLLTLDKVPYVGAVTSGMPNVHLASGFGKWGMSGGTAAAMLLSDSITGRDNPYLKLYTPQRFHVGASIKNVISENANVAKYLIAGKLEMVHKHVEDLQLGEGGVVSFNGKRAGAYKERDGVVHLVDTTCTHMGCELDWNNGDRTWDCPCHGSRFSYDGEVIEGPATKALKKLSPNNEEPEDLDTPIV
ncbi:FAD-dependent oxidoreductase [Paenibacillus nasutitermitis]|uniref:(2Fe-2S)-binding protein n=1 Tax=Paenibacillus nasutitermitis TaxID=1652958 RepID=A0A917DYH1_9BACL|nr:FAD-dependent oxidoreductase [Paenibacillus nasutitermitis]GGD83602.1 (2Fe-2S)-binding protein [Paenibacillus nasutitermitis]